MKQTRLKNKFLKHSCEANKAVSNTQRKFCVSRMGRLFEEPKISEILEILSSLI